jgi:glucan phosphoethanolaminetransferase (alkaline phosphatase superfamily)
MADNNNIQKQTQVPIQIGQQIKKGNVIEFIKPTEYFPILFRYVILIVFYFYVFYFFRENSMRYILFIIVFILNFFTIVFLYRDLIGTGLVSNILTPSFSFNIQRESGVFVKLFIFILFATLLLQLCSLSIILAVFDYGKNLTKNFYTSTMTDSNKEIMDKYIDWLKWYFIMIGMFVYAIAVSYSSDRIKNILVNVGLFIPSGVILGCSIYGIMLAVQFLDNKKYNRSLYS